MPALDVSDAILDVEFIDTLSIIRRPYTTDSHGRVTVTPQNLTATGVVTQGSPNPFEQVADDQYGKTALTVHAYNFQLFDPTTGPLNNYQPDILVYQGNHYVITNVLNWSRYGVGFTMALASQYDFTNSAN